MGCIYACHVHLELNRCVECGMALIQNFHHHKPYMTYLFWKVLRRFYNKWCLVDICFIVWLLPTVSHKHYEINPVLSVSWGSIDHCWIPITTARNAGLWPFSAVGPSNLLNQQPSCGWFESPSPRLCGDAISKIYLVSQKHGLHTILADKASTWSIYYTVL